MHLMKSRRFRSTELGPLHEGEHSDDDGGSLGGSGSEGGDALPPPQRRAHEAP